MALAPEGTGIEHSRKKIIKSALPVYNCRGRVSLSARHPAHVPLFWAILARARRRRRGYLISDRLIPKKENRGSRRTGEVKTGDATADDADRPGAEAD